MKGNTMASHPWPATHCPGRTRRSPIKIQTMWWQPRSGHPRILANMVARTALLRCWTQHWTCEDCSFIVLDAILDQWGLSFYGVGLHSGFMGTFFALCWVSLWLSDNSPYLYGTGPQTALLKNCSSKVLDSPLDCNAGRQRAVLPRFWTAHTEAGTAVLDHSQKSMCDINHACGLASILQGCFTLGDYLLMPWYWWESGSNPRIIKQTGETFH